MVALKLSLIFNIALEVGWGFMFSQTNTTSSVRHQSGLDRAQSGFFVELLLGMVDGAAVLFFKDPLIILIPCGLG